MRQGSSLQIRSAVVNVLTRDTLVVLYFAVAATEALIYSFPVLDPGTLTAFGASPFQIPFVATVAIAGFYGLGRIQDREEQIFWRNLAFASVFWLATLAAIAVVPKAQWRWIDDVWADAAYLLFYSPVLFAAECKPYQARPGFRGEVERQLRWVGVTLLVLGWYFYFIVAAALTDPPLFGTMLPSSLLFMTLDVTVVVRFAWRAYASGSARWRVMYSTLALAGGSLLVTDTFDALEALRLFALPDGAKTDLLWAIPPFFLLLAFRFRAVTLPRETTEPVRERASAAKLDPVRIAGFLVGSALGFPLVHFAVQPLFPQNGALLAAQQTVVAAELLLLGALAVAAFLHLECQRVEVERRRSALEDRTRRAQTLEAVSRMAGVVADRYSATLKSLDGLGHRAIDRLGPGDPLRAEAVRGLEQLGRAVEFTNALRAISRQDRGLPARLDLRMEVAGLLPALEQAVGPPVHVEHAPAPEACTTMVDPTHLRVMLLDLATNARDAMPRGGRLRIETGTVALDADVALEMAVRPGKYVRLCVRDTGSGIPKEALAHLFEPFLSTKPGESGGQGLGLATLYALVSMYGGCINVTSRPGETAFEILLPYSR
jgi:signal transduction histidine kinase